MLHLLTHRQEVERIVMNTAAATSKMALCLCLHTRAAFPGRLRVSLIIWELPLFASRVARGWCWVLVCWWRLVVCEAFFESHGELPVSLPPRKAT